MFVCFFYLKKRCCIVAHANTAASTDVTIFTTKFHNFFDRKNVFEHFFHGQKFYVRSTVDLRIWFSLNLHSMDKNIENFKLIECLLFFYYTPLNHQFADLVGDVKVTKDSKPPLPKVHSTPKKPTTPKATDPPKKPTDKLIKSARASPRVTPKATPLQSPGAEHPPLIRENTTEIIKHNNGNEDVKTEEKNEEKKDQGTEKSQARLKHFFLVFLTQLGIFYVSVKLFFLKVILYFQFFFSYFEIRIWLIFRPRDIYSARKWWNIWRKLSFRRTRKMWAT